MAGKLIRTLAGFGAHRRPVGVRLLAVALGGTLFLGVVPWLLWRLARWVLPAGLPGLPHGVEILLALMFIALGLGLIAWTVSVQWRRGQGTPAPVVPPVRLITTGPYALCRNPLQLGVILYYLGMGTALGTLYHGLLCFAVGLALGVAYHSRVEERELELRFGQDYMDYRARTPFLIPRWPGARRRRTG